MKFTLKVGKEKKRLRIIRDDYRIDEELYKYQFKKHQRSLLQDRETDEERKERKEKEADEEKRIKEAEEREERLKELERKEAIITKYWNEFVIANKGKLLELDMSKVVEDTIPLSVAKEEIQLAYERGMEDGQMQAMVTYKTEIEKYQEWIRRIDSVTNELKKEHLFAIKNFEDNMIDLSATIAESILDEKITEDNSIVIKQVRKAIASVYNEKIFKIHVNPELVKLLEEVKSTLLLDSQEAEKIEIYPNPTVPIGGCLLETSGGLLDGRVKNQLRKIYKELQIENERIFNTKELQEELNNFYEDIDESEQNKNNNNDDIEDIDVDDFDYDDMPEEYKEMFGEDIFGQGDLDLEGNLMPEKEEEVNKEEEVSDEIDYAKIYEEELKQKEEEEINKLMDEENNEGNDNDKEDLKFDLDIENDEEKSEIELDYFNFDENEGNKEDNEERNDEKNNNENKNENKSD